VNEVLWDDDAGTWLDYDIINQKRRPYFTPTNLSPLWTNCFDQSRRQHIADKVLQYINKTGIDDYPGGVPNTLYQSGEQWDFPNVWAPMQHILIIGLENLNDARTSEIAHRWAERWVQSNFVTFTDTGAMYEKYVATEFGASGGGGEYEVQKGFGWSNGAILDLLDRYGSTLKAPGLRTNYIVKLP
jgi:alpha,alpha-trehalase